MFDRPQSPQIELKSIEDLIKYSLTTSVLPLALPCHYQDLQSHFIFTDSNGKFYLTPYWEDCIKLFNENGYETCSLLLNPQTRGALLALRNSSKCEQLSTIAQQENRSRIYIQCFEDAQQRNVKSYEIAKPYPRIEATFSPACFIIPENFPQRKVIFTGLVDFAHRPLKRNTEFAGTYLRYSPELLLICDEFGRSFALPYVAEALDHLESHILYAGFSPNESISSNVVLAES